MFWKIYFWFLLVLVLPRYLQGFSRLWQVIEFICFVAAMIGLFAFSWQKKMFTWIFWRAFLPLYTIGHLFFQYFLYMPQTTPDVGFGVLPQTILATILWLPLVIALYLYGFKRTELWKN